MDATWRSAKRSGTVAKTKAPAGKAKRRKSVAKVGNVSAPGLQVPIPPINQRSLDAVPVKGSSAAQLLTTLIPVELIALYGVVNAWDLDRWLSLALALTGALMAIGLTYYDYRINPTNDRKAQVAHMCIAPLAFLIWGATLRSPYVRLFGLDPDEAAFGISVTAIAVVFTSAATVLYKIVGKVPDVSKHGG